MIYYYFLPVSLSDVNMKLSFFYRIKVYTCKKYILNLNIATTLRYCQTNTDNNCYQYYLTYKKHL